MTKDNRELVTNLRTSDEDTQGRPQLPAEEVESARNYLSLLLLEVRAEIAHIGLLEELYRAKFRYPLERWFWRGEPRPPLEVAAGFRHHQFLSEETARAVAERGPAALSLDELAVVLLNPYALWDLSDLIHFLVPDHWRDRMAQSGQEYIDRHGLTIPIHGLDEPTAAEHERKHADDQQSGATPRLPHDGPPDLHPGSTTRGEG